MALLFNQIQTLNNFFMKKIIYSLVAMLFVGGIFTSCITPVEPDGINAMRNAHAEYLLKLAGLTQANEAVVAAEAALKNAQAAVEQARAAQEQAIAKSLELANELQAAQNKQDIQAILDQMEEDALTHQIAMNGLQAALAQSMKDLKDALAALDIEALHISDEEATALQYIVDQVDYWAGQLEAAYGDLGLYAIMNYQDLYDSIAEGKIDDASIEYLHAFLENEIAVSEYKLTYLQKEADYWKNLIDNFTTDFLPEIEAYEQANKDLAVEFADLLRDSVLLANTYGPVRDAKLDANAKDYEKATKGAADAFDKAVKDIKGNVIEPSDGKDGKEKAKAKSFTYAFDKEYALPEHVAGDVVTAYEQQAGLFGFAEQVKFVTTAGKPDSLKVTIKTVDKEATYKYIVDTIWEGNQETEARLKMKTGLWSVYEDFGRSYLYDLDAEGIKADKDILEAYAKKVKGEYDSILNILTSAKEGQGQALLKAWADKVAKAGKDVEALAKKIDEYQNRSGESKYDVYKYNDALSEIPAKGPVVLVDKTNKPRKVTVNTSDPTEFDLAATTDPYFTSDPTRNITIAPTPADSAKVFNAIVDYFKAIAAIDADAVPYLKFMASKDGGMTYKIDSVRADQMVYAGIQMVKTNGHVKDNGINMAAPYDNKGMTSEGATVSPTEYDDAFGNVIKLFNHYVHNEGLTSLYATHDYDYSASTSGVADYIQYVTDFKNDNAAENLDGFKKVFDTYTEKDFEKYTSMSDEGKALANWMDANEKYYGVEGFAGFTGGKKVYFDLNTFTVPTEVAVFAGIPDYTKDAKKGVTGIARVDVVNPWSNQFTFVDKSIWQNLAKADGTTNTAQDYLGWDDAADPFTGTANTDLVMKSLVFEVLEANYLVAVASGEKSISEIWEALGEVLKQVKADMDAVVDAAAGKAEKSAEDAAAYNEALATYRAATKDAAAAKKAADKAAKDEYDAYFDELGAKFEELLAEKEFNDKMIAGLKGAYALWSDGVPAASLIDYFSEMYGDALEAAAELAEYIAENEIYLNGIEDPTLDEWLSIYIQAYYEYMGVYEEQIMRNIEHAEYWYEYWKAVYEAAMAKYAE